MSFISFRSFSEFDEMKLQRRLSREYNDKKYHKYIIVIPEKEVKKSGFKEGNDLTINSKRGEIKISKQN